MQLLKCNLAIRGRGVCWIFVFTLNQLFPTIYLFIISTRSIHNTARKRAGTVVIEAYFDDESRRYNVKESFLTKSFSNLMLKLFVVVIFLFLFELSHGEVYYFYFFVSKAQLVSCQIMPLLRHLRAFFFTFSLLFLFCITNI
jgi:hypothetical protein